MSRKKRVYVGMSGGVDSSLSAAMLVEQGYDVTGAYMKNWSEDLPGFSCPWQEDYEDAMRVAVQLGIDFKLYDFQSEYRQKVVDYMIEGYKQGITPNPDIMCNQEIKFKLFLDTALSSGADVIATGHYARTKNGRLYAGLDTNKDQSYFLYRVSSQALEKSIFPLGDMDKPSVRKEAKRRGLATAEKKDSQGICFIGDVGIEDFLRQFVETEPGEIIDSSSNKVLGEHDGALFYTIGQRHGLGIGGGLPYYVVGKNMQKNEVYVSNNIDDERLWTEQMHISAPHWISEPPKEATTYRVRVRHRGALNACTISLDDPSQPIINLKDPLRAVAAGQSAVLYDGEQVIGGGIIATR
ncbi:MAG: tRNA 2-thiouridine(34) synthase MnmA [Actinobacteria bacterium]|nr:tRNA 2-thiouridine(34) synthase MnmA [Actinomycetota bacterium]